MVYRIFRRNGDLFRVLSVHGCGFWILQQLQPVVDLFRGGDHIGPGVSRSAALRQSQEPPPEEALPMRPLCRRIGSSVWCQRHSTSKCKKDSTDWLYYLSISYVTSFFSEISQQWMCLIYSYSASLWIRGEQCRFRGHGESERRVAALCAAHGASEVRPGWVQDVSDGFRCAAKQRLPNARRGNGGCELIWFDRSQDSYRTDTWWMWELCIVLAEILEWTLFRFAPWIAHHYHVLLGCLWCRP